MASAALKVGALHASRLFSVAGKVAIVTGGSRGIGEMITEALVQNGAKVFITARSVEACEETATRLNAAGPGVVIPVPGDLQTEEGCKATIDTIRGQTDKLDVLVNNAGTTWGQDFSKYPDKAWDRVFNLNVKAMFTMTREAAPLLDAGATAQDPGRVINIGSIAGLMPQPIPTFAYDASKAAVHMLTRKLATELADRRKHGGHSITVNAIAPGFVPSKMSAQLLTYATEDQIKACVPLGRLGEARDMGGVTLFLASDAGTWVTGAVIPVDGGTTATPFAMAEGIM